VEMLACCGVFVVAWLTVKLTTSDVLQKVMTWLRRVPKGS